MCVRGFGRVTCWVPKRCCRRRRHRCRGAEGADPAAAAEHDALAGHRCRRAACHVRRLHRLLFLGQSSSDRAVAHRHAGESCIDLRAENERHSKRLIHANKRMLKYEAEIRAELTTHGDEDGFDAEDPDADVGFEALDVAEGKHADNDNDDEEEKEGRGPRRDTGSWISGTICPHPASGVESWQQQQRQQPGARAPWSPPACVDAIRS